MRALAEAIDSLLISPASEIVSTLTQRGRRALEVVYLNSSIESHNNPDIAFAMTPSFLEAILARKEKLCIELGMPQDEGERATIIADYKQELERHGFPHWRVIDFPISTDGVNSEK